MFGEGVFDVARCEQRFDVDDIGMFSVAGFCHPIMCVDLGLVWTHGDGGL